MITNIKRREVGVPPPITPPNKNPRQTEKIDANLYRDLVGGVMDIVVPDYMHYSMAFPLTVFVSLNFGIIDSNFRLMKNSSIPRSQGYRWGEGGGGIG